MKPESTNGHLTLTGWANKFGIDRQTLARSLENAGVATEPHGYIPGPVIYKALVSDSDAEKRRLQRAQAEEKERENRLADGIIVEMPDVEKHIVEHLIQPLGEALNGMGMALGQVVNPQAPEEAAKQIDGYIERTIKPHLRERLK